jgi:hypothetical protein
MDNFNKKDMHLFTSMLEEIGAVLHNKADQTPSGIPHSQHTVKPATEALEELKELFDDGIITEEEYRAKREKYLSQM